MSCLRGFTLYNKGPKSYKSYCRETLIKSPEAYRPTINIVKPNKKKVLQDIPQNELHKITKDGWRPTITKTKKSDLEIIGMEIKIKGHKLDLNILELPEGIDRKNYNRIWMHNSRIRQRIKKLKEKYGDNDPL